MMPNYKLSLALWAASLKICKGLITSEICKYSPDWETVGDTELLGVAWGFVGRAAAETPSLTYYLLYMRIQCHCIHSCEVLSTPHSHIYNFLNTTYSCAVLGLSSTQ